MLKLLLAILAMAAVAPAATPLDSYLDDLKTLRATFLQTLADAHGKEIDRSTGTLIVARPGKFSWEIHPQASSAGAGGAGAGPGGGAAGGAGSAGARPGGASAGAGSGGAGSTGAGSGASGGQLMVADGRNLWFLDRDLQQVTVKPADAALSATPAMLLSGTVDVRKNFTITPAPKRDGLDWVMVEPHGSEADFRRALLGFDSNGAGPPALKRMILEDKLGQTATVMFDHIERNGHVAPEEVSFTPPPGVDVIGTPKK
jgi:outer membrane lipoprotein carrier protein